MDGGQAAGGASPYMSLNIFQSQSIKTKVTLFTLAIFVIGIWSLEIYTNFMLHEDMRRQLGEQQLMTVSYVATQIDNRLDDRVRALEKVARQVSPGMMGNPAAALQAMLEQSPILQILFNDGIVAYRLDGTAVAEAPLSGGRIGLNFMDRDHVAATLTDGKATISKPHFSKRAHLPEFAMVEPIRDTHGNIIGALAGITNLDKANFLDAIRKQHYGKTGGYLLVAPQHRLIITATDKSHLMETLSTNDLNLFNKFLIQDNEGTTIAVNPLGVEQLVSAKRIPLAGWYAVAALPTAEAFASIHNMQQRMLLATAFLTLLAGGLIWWMIRRQLLPLFTTLERLATMSDTNQQPQPLPITRQDEIGKLIGGFNRLLGTLKQKEDLLQESELRYRTVANFTSDWEFWITPDGTFRYISPSCEQISGYTPDEFYTDPQLLTRIIHPDDLPLWARHTHTLSAQGVPEPIDYRILTKDGKYRWISHICRPVYDAARQPLGYRASNRDVTERKQMENQVRQLAFYDTLTKLSNRRLLNDRLNQAMAASKRSGCYGAVMFLDLDNFKPLNDTHGHEVGDLLLIEAADRLKSCVRAMDTVARFGGDEFVIMINELGTDKAESILQAAVVAEKIRTALSEPYLLTIKDRGKADPTVKHRCTASIGVALFINHEASQDDILKWADTAMYQAKDAGRNSIRFHDADTQLLNRTLDKPNAGG